MKYSILKQLLPVLILVYSNEILFAQSKTEGQPLKVIIIRHAEKPEQGDNLSCQGLNRALQLPEVLYGKFKLPDHIFASSINTGKTTGTARMYQTIVPFAIKYNLNINSKFEVGEEDALAKSILKKKGTVLVVWEHNNIPKIAKELGVKEDKLKWKGSDFDSIWIITFKNGNAELRIDKENINPSADCK
jgi:hypothetical protein